MTSTKLIVILTLSICGCINAAPKKEQPESSPKGDGELPTDPTLLARYVVAKSDWLSLATISSLNGVTGYPFVSLKSTSDGIARQHSGIPYLYMSKLETSSRDLEKDDRVTIMVSLAQTDYCKNKNLDQQNPLCPKVFIVGKFVKLDKTSAEYKPARNALFESHPEMKTWPDSDVVPNHGFYVAKVEPVQIRLLGHHGAVKEITKDTYLSADISDLI